MLLPEPRFIDTDPNVVLRDCMAFVEGRLGRPLEPAQVEKVLVEMVAYRESLIRVAIQETGKQNLLAYARYPMIDLIAQLVGVSRTPAKSARTTLEFTVTPSGATRLFPQGARVRSGDGRVTFATLQDAVITAGNGSVTVDAVCLATGPVGNGFSPGQISRISADLGFEAEVANLTASSGGAVEETTDELRLRLPFALDEYSAAGPAPAYVALAKKAHPDVIDARALRPSPGAVNVVVLARDGVPSEGVLTAVLEYLTHEDREQLLVTTTVSPAEPVDYTVSAVLEMEPGVVAAGPIEQARAGLSAYVEAKRKLLSSAPVPSQLVTLANVPGVHRVSLAYVEPTLAEHEFAHCTSVTVSPA